MLRAKATYSLDAHTDDFTLLMLSCYIDIISIAIYISFTKLLDVEEVLVIIIITIIITSSPTNGPSIAITLQY